VDGRDGGTGDAGVELNIRNIIPEPKLYININTLLAWLWK
jgi:hypothetical protein